MVLDDIQRICRKYSKEAAGVWVDIALDSSFRPSDRIACSKLIIDYALLGLQINNSDDTLSNNNFKIEIRGLSNES